MLFFTTTKLALPTYFTGLLLPHPLQVIESLAREDTDIKPEHIALIKQLIQREEQEEQSAASS